MSSRPVPADRIQRISEEKSEGLLRLPGQHLPHFVSQHMQQSGAVATAKSALASRPIAPAPLQQGSHATAAGIIPKLPVGLGITPDVRAVPQQVAVNLSAQVASMTSTSFSVTQSGPTMQSVAITPGSSLHLSGGNLVQPQLTQVKTGINVTMASLIRSGAGIPGTLQASGQLSTVSSSHSAGATQTASVTQSPLGHTFPTHLPRGAAAVSALTGPRGNAVATPMLRSSSQTTAGMHIPSTNTTVGPHMHQIPSRMLHVRPNTPPVPRANAPATQADIHRVTHGGTTATSNAVQITIQHPRDMPSRPLHSASNLSNQASSLSKQSMGFNPTPVQSAHLGQSQKLLMTQGALQAGSAAGSVVSVAATRPGRTAGQATVALNMNQQPVMARTQKILTTQAVVATTATTPTMPGVLQSQMFGISRPQGTQKVIVSHTTVSTTVQPGTLITTVAKSVPTGSALNLCQAISRQPKVVSHAAHTAIVSTTAGVPATTITKTAAKVQPQRVLHAAHTVGTDATSIVRETAPVSSVQSHSTPSSVFLAQTQRSSTTTLPTTTAVATTHTDSRPGAERTNFSSTANPYTLPLEYNTYYNPTLMNYTSLMYQQVAAAAAAAQQQQAMTSISSGSVRPGFNKPAHHNVGESSGGGISVALTAAVSAASAAVANQNPATSGHPPRQSSPGVTGSPRPSILRKRPTDGVAIVKKNLLGSMAEAAASCEAMSASVTNPNTISPRSTVLDPSRENSQSSTDTASSAESTPTGVEVKIKQEPPDGIENGTSVNISGTNSTEATPRKKPRKQFLCTNEDYQGIDSEDEEIKQFSINVNLKKELEKAAEEVKKEDLEEYYDEEGVRWVKERKRPPVNLLNHYSCTWKARHNHFLRYSEVKSKEERRPTVNELANQKAVHQKTSGWKMYHISAQLEQLMDMEKDVQMKLLGIQDTIAPKNSTKNPTMEDDIGMVHELSQGNIQRCRLLVDQLEESRQSILKVLEHKKRIGDIITKHHSKRPVKKKERP